MIHQTQIKHLYWRAGFGHTLEDRQRLSGLSVSEVVNDLFKKSAQAENIEVIQESAPEFKDVLEMSKEERRELIQKSRALIRALNVKWLAHITNTQAQLREKMTFFWHGHFACQARSIYHAQQYVNTLRKYALGNFGDLVLAIAKEPAMLQFLNNQQNRKKQPNENFARELMELFTLGRGNYTEQDIKESARAFTGWGFDGANYVFREQAHDFDTKTFMGKSGNFNGDDIIRIILENPQTAYFITKKIYQFFVSPQANEARIHELAQSFYQSGYDMGALMKQIFLADWFYAPENVGVRIKSPIELIAGLQRQLNMRFLTEDAPLFIQKLLGQILLFPPNVAGWPGGRSWIDSSTLMFRLKLPEALYKASEITIAAKEDGDIQNDGLVKDKLNRFQGEFDWTTLTKYFAKSSTSEELYTQLSDFLLSKEAPNLKDYALNVLKQNPENDRIKVLSILQCSLPEYQLC